MTATIDVNERKLKQVRKITGLTDDSKVVNWALDKVIRGAKLQQALFFKDTDTWDGYDRREDK